MLSDLYTWPCIYFHRYKHYYLFPSIPSYHGFTYINKRILYVILHICIISIIYSIRYIISDIFVEGDFHINTYVFSLYTHSDMNMHRLKDNLYEVSISNNFPLQKVTVY